MQWIITDDRLNEKKLIAIQRKLSLAEAQEESLKSIASLGGMIAHELRTPLLTIGMGLKGINEYFSEILLGYQSWKKLHKECDNINPEIVEHIKSVFSNIQLSINKSNNTINQLLNGLQDITKESKEQLNLIDAKQSILASIEQYPFLEGEKSKIEIKTLISSEIYLIMMF